MENKNNLFVIFIRLSCLVLFIILFSMVGCRSKMDSRVTIINDKREVFEQKSLEKGYMAFQLRDFQQAENIFNSLQYAGNEKISQKAIYALSCTQLVKADTPEAAKKAFDRWKTWRDLSHRSTDCKEIKLLEVLLETMISRSHEEKQTKVELNTEGERLYQMQLYTRDKQINQLSKKIKAMKGEIILLKKKIKSIEEIDQKIQEKKEEPPPP